MIGITSFLDLLTFGVSVAIVTLLVLAVSLCAAMVIDYWQRR